MEWFKGVFNKVFKPSEIRLLMVGLDSAGKTTLLYKLKLGEIQAKHYFIVFIINMYFGLFIIDS